MTAERRGFDRVSVNTQKRNDGNEPADHDLSTTIQETNQRKSVPSAESAVYSSLADSELTQRSMRSRCV